MAIPDPDMPQLFRAANEASLAGQHTYLQLTRLRLGMIVTAACCGIGSWRVGEGNIDLLGLLALLLFVGALVVESYLWNQHPERDWFDGRAVAESTKTLAWKFAVGGDPFSIATPPGEAGRLCTNVLDGLRP